MDIDELFWYESAAQRAVAHIRDWWKDGGETVLSHMLEACLVVALIASLWSLIRPWLPIKAAHAANQESVVTPRMEMVSQAPRLDIDSLSQAHLFGVAVHMPVVIASDPTIQVNGIVYSSDANQSLAILTVNGTTLLAHRGTVLSDGSTVLDVAPDRIIANRNGHFESLTLDLKKAALNAHFTPAQFARGSIANGNSTSNTSAINELEQTSGTAPAAVPATSVTRVPRLVMPHFESLQQLRGGHERQRFKKLSPPVGQIPGQHG